MAKNTILLFKEKPPKKRKGIHAKSKMSKSKSSKLYKKSYNRQGR
jgi:hypothetical protein